MRDIERLATAGNPDAQLAINIYAYRVRKYIGAYMAAMGGPDAIVFTGGIGENSPSMRRRICDAATPLRRATDDTVSPGSKLSSMIRSFCSSTNTADAPSP